MLWIVWDPTPGRSSSNDKDRPRMKFWGGRKDELTYQGWELHVCAYANDKLASEKRRMCRFEHGEKLWHEWLWDQLEPPKHDFPRIRMGR